MSDESESHEKVKAKLKEVCSYFGFLLFLKVHDILFDSFSLNLFSSLAHALQFWATFIRNIFDENN